MLKLLRVASVALLGFAVSADVLGYAAERWLYVAAPHFTLLTTLEAKRAVNWANDFSQFVGAMDGFIKVDKTKLPKLTIIVFANEREFARYRPFNSAGKPKEVAGFFSRRESWAVAGLAGGDLDEDSRETIYHEGTHWFLSAFEYSNPMWIEEGVAEAFSTFTVDEKNIVWGRALDRHVYWLAREQLLPLQQLLRMTADDLFHGKAEDDVRTGLAYAESWAFVHYLLFGRREVPQTALSDYMKLSRSAPGLDDAFRTAFGRDYRAMDKTLGSYLHGGKYYITKLPRLPLPSATVRDATKAEVEDGLGRLDLAAGRFTEAQAHADQAEALTPNDPKCDELLGEIFSESHAEDKALVAYRSAITKGSRDFRPFFAVAQAEHSSGGSWDGTLNLDATQARRVVNLYERVINLNPHFLPAYQNMAGVLEIIPQLNAEDPRFLEYGEKVYPDDGMIRLGQAVAAMKSKETERAETLLHSVLDPANHQPRHVIEYAQRLELSWTSRDISEHLRALFEAERYGEVVALTDQELPKPLGVQFHRYLQEVRGQAVAMVSLEKARTAMDDQHWSEARKLLAEVRSSNAPAALKAEAKRRLDRLNEQNLGDPTPGK